MLYLYRIIYFKFLMGSCKQNQVNCQKKGFVKRTILEHKGHGLV